MKIHKALGVALIACSTVLGCDSVGSTSPPERLIAETWSLQRANLAGAGVQVDASTGAYVLQFGDAEFTAQFGCVLMRGAYSVEDQRIHTSNVARLNSGCQPAEFDESVAEVLRQASRYTFTFSGLTIFGEGDDYIFFYGTYI